MFNRYPYTNFHELNLDYFIQHFREIFTEWEQLYNELQSWKTDTAEELDQWRADVEEDLDEREAALRAELEIWKQDTADDISEWETTTLSALDAWKTAATAQFEAIRVQAAASAEAAAASQIAAETARTQAQTAQAAAEAATQSVQASAAQIQQNADDISDLKESFVSLDDGTFDTDLMGFAVGNLSTSGVYRDDTKYRICTPDIFTANIDLYVKPITGYRIYIIYYDSGTTITNRIGWIEFPVLFKAGMRIKMTIARKTEDTSEEVTVAQMLEGVIFNPFHVYKNDVETNALYSGDYTGLLKCTGAIELGNYSIGDVVDVSPLDNYSPTSTKYCTVILDNIIEGETIELNAAGGSVVRPWAFLDADNKLLSMNDDAEAYNVTLNAPVNAKFLIVQVGFINYQAAKIIRKRNLTEIKTELTLEEDKNRDRWKKVIGSVYVYKGNYKPLLSLTNPVLLGNYSAGEVVDLTPLDTTGRHYTVLINEIVENEVFSISARDGNTARPWAFLDKDNKLISMADGSYADNIILTAPANAEYLLIQIGSVIASDYENAYIRRQLDIENLNSDVRHIHSGDYKSAFKRTEPVLLGNYQAGDVVDILPLFIAGNAHYTLLIENVTPGEEFFINSTDGSTARPWAFLDKDNKLISMADSAYATNVTLKAPENSVYLIVQVGNVHYANAKVIRYNSFSDYAKNSGINALNQYADIINKMENASNSAKSDTNTAVKNRANLLNLIHFSDIHGDTTNISRLIEFINLYSSYIHGVLHTGDSVTTYYGDANPFAAVGGDEVMNVIGNHDCWIQGDTWPSPYNATAQQAYEKFIAPFISNWSVISPGTNLCYYYKDYSAANTRVIVLDCIHYDSAQETWFASILADAITNELRVVAVTHYPAQTGITGIDCTFNSITQTINAVADPAAGTQIERMPESAFTAVDTFINNGGEFVCWLSGHTHDDFIGVVKNHIDQIQIIISTGGTSNRYSDCARTKNTKTEDLFNVFTVDGNAKLIKIIRIGSTMDKFMRKRNTLCINYQTKNIISNN